MAENNTEPPAPSGRNNSLTPFWLGLASLGLALLGVSCLWPLVILAIPLGHSSLRQAREKRVYDRGYAWAGLILAYFFLAFMLLSPFLVSRPLDCPTSYWQRLGEFLRRADIAGAKARRVNCAGNLKQVGLALLTYSGENRGYFPLPPPGNNFEPLNTGQFLTDGKVYGCPSAMVLQTTAAASNYRYLGSGLRDDHPEATTTVLAHDEADNHCGKWINALFVDGHVTGCAAASIEEACQKQGWLLPSASRRPPPPPPAPPP